MHKVPTAGALYFAIVFGVGFLLGPIRVLWLEPKLGATLAVLIEAPLLLIAMVAAARWVPRKLGMDTGVAPMAAMGVVALALVLAADVAVGRWLRGLSVTDAVRQFATLSGQIYAASLLLFALMPLLVNRARGRP